MAQHQVGGAGGDQAVGTQQRGQVALVRDHLHSFLAGAPAEDGAWPTDMRAVRPTAMDAVEEGMIG